MKSDRYYAPYNKVVIEVDHSTFMSFGRITYDEYESYRLLGDSTSGTEKCFYILHQEYKHGRTVYEVIGEYKLFERALRRFKKLKDEV